MRAPGARRMASPSMRSSGGWPNAARPRSDCSESCRVGRRSVGTSVRVSVTVSWPSSLVAVVLVVWLKAGAAPSSRPMAQTCAMTFREQRCMV